MYLTRYCFLPPAAQLAKKYGVSVHINDRKESELIIFGNRGITTTPEKGGSMVVSSWNKKIPNNLNHIVIFTCGR